MKLIILQEKLKKGLDIVERIVTKLSTLPILNNILLTTEKNFLNLTTTDLEVGIKWWALAKIEKEGKIIIPAHILSNFIGLLPQKPILLEERKNNLLISCEKFQTEIKGFSPEEFPIIPKINEENPLILPSQLFCQSLAQVADIPIPSTTRPEISGVKLTFQKDLISMAATDSFRLGEKKLFLEKPLTQEFSFILPQKTTKEIINIFSEKGKEIRFYFSPNQVMFETLMTETSHPEIQFSSRLIEGEYPNYQEIIPKKYETQIHLEKDKFFNQIKIASLFSGKTNEVKIKVDPKKNEVEILSQNPEIGQYQSSLSATVKGEEVEISFNYRFLIDGLSNIKSSEVIFELNGQDGPGILKPVGDQNYIYVMMPIKAS